MNRPEERKSVWRESTTRSFVADWLVSFWLSDAILSELCECVCCFVCVFLWWISACGEQHAESSSSSSALFGAWHWTAFLLFFSPLHSFPLHLHLSPLLLSHILFLLFSLLCTTDGFICMPMGYVSFYFSLSHSLSLLTLFLSHPFMPRGPLSSFWVYLSSSLCHYLYFVYYSCLLFPLQLTFSFFSSPFTATPLPLCHSP